MKQIKFKELSLESFKKFGSFSDMLCLTAEKLNPGLVEFYRDMEQVAFPAGAIPSFSVTRAQNRPKVIEKFEYHNLTGEGIMPLDGDILIHLAPASRSQNVPYDRIEVFHVPKGTFVSIRPGVWHQAPFAYQCESVNTLVFLPERAYENDCKVVVFPDENKIEIIE
jgi:ureidoglycolate lyase